MWERPLFRGKSDASSTQADGVWPRLRFGLWLTIRLEGQPEKNLRFEFNAHRQRGILIAIPPDAEMRLGAELQIADGACHVNDGLRVRNDAAFAELFAHPGVWR